MNIGRLKQQSLPFLFYSGEGERCLSTRMGRNGATDDDPAIDHTKRLTKSWHSTSDSGPQLYTLPTQHKLFQDLS